MGRTESLTLLTTAELGKLLKKPESTLRYWRMQGYGPPWLKLGKTVKYRFSDVYAWIDSQVNH